MLEIRSYIKSRPLLGTRPFDIHREVCDIYVGGVPATTTSKGNIEKKNPQYAKMDTRFTVRQLARMTKLVVSTSSWNFKET